MFPAKYADEEEDRRDEPGQDDHHNHLDNDEYDDEDDDRDMVMVRKMMVMTVTLCPVRHALYLVANFTEQNLWKGNFKFVSVFLGGVCGGGIKLANHGFMNEEQTKVHSLSGCSSYLSTVIRRTVNWETRQTV